MNFSHPTTEHDLIDLDLVNCEQPGTKSVCGNELRAHFYIIFDFGHFEAQNTFPGLSTVFSS